MTVTLHALRFVVNQPMNYAADRIELVLEKIEISRVTVFVIPTNGMRDQIGILDKTSGLGIYKHGHICQIV